MLSSTRFVRLDLRPRVRRGHEEGLLQSRAGGEAIRRTLMKRVEAPAVYLIRHGQTRSNLMGLYAGRSREGLTPTGRQQVRHLAEQLTGLGLSEIWTSEITRAVETADLLAGLLGLPARLELGLNEMGMGPWEGLSEKEVAATFPAAYQLWENRPDLLSLNGRERLQDVAIRVSEVVARASAATHGVLLVSHVAPIRVAVLGALGLPLGWYRRLRVANADCFELRVKSHEVRRLGKGRSLVPELELTSLRRNED